MRRQIIAFVCMVLTAVSVLPVRAGAEEALLSIPVSFYTPGMGVMNYEFPYSDSFFLDAGEEFSRDIAKASMGLMYSAFREIPEFGPENQYEVYLKAAGFQDIYSFGYDRETGTDTLSGVIAYKKIGGFTLIAAAPAGQGYDKEWGGNLEVGTGERHAGFQKGAEIMEQELFRYIELHEFDGDLKLWITGFSRAAAVGNLTAADLYESGRFSCIFAYLYGVPRTTRKPAPYPGIYNICGKYDPVTLVPLESWGFGRCGMDLFTPAIETNTNYLDLMGRASDVAAEIAGDFLRFNPELNYQYHLIMEFLGEMFPDQLEYVEKMQGEIMGIWTEANPDQIFVILTSVFQQLDDLNARQEYSSKIFLDYLAYIASLYLENRRESMELRSFVWAEDQQMAANLFREHMPYIYASWIFSDLTDEELFGGPTETRRLTILGNVDVEVWINGVFLTGITSSGHEFYYEELFDQYDYQEMISTVFLIRNGEETLICLPVDSSFEIHITLPERENFIYYDVLCPVDQTYGTVSNLFSVVADKGNYLLSFPEDGVDSKLIELEGKIFQFLELDLVYSPTMIMQIESSAGNHFTIGGIMAGLMLSFLFLMILLLVCIVIAVVHKIRKKKHGPYSPYYVIIPHLLAAFLFVVLHRYVTVNLYAITSVRVILASLSMLILFLLSLRGLLRNRCYQNLIITGTILSVGLLNSLWYQRSEFLDTSIWQFIIYCVVLSMLAVLACRTFFDWKKK